MNRIYLDSSDLPRNIYVKSELPSSIQIDASDLQRTLDNFLQSLSYVISEGTKIDYRKKLILHLASNSSMIYDKDTTAERIIIFADAIIKEMEKENE